MTKTILGIFQNADQAAEAINELRDRGFEAKDISIIMRNEQEAQEFADTTGTSVGEGAVTGATTGAALGGLAGLLIGIGAITIPGVGAFLIGGPIATALGLTGAAASTVAGATTGAIAGGVVGALVGLGVPQDEATVYEQRIQEGGILLAVPAHAENDDIVIDILEDNGADQIRSVTHRTEEESETMDDRYQEAIDASKHSYAIGAKGGRVNKKKLMRG